MPERRCEVPYCFSCGRLRDTSGGLCRQCSLDEQARRNNAARNEHVRIMLGIRKAAAGEPRPTKGEDTK